jgi:chromatin structure-remodeling complex subunit RSC1/2
MIGPFERMPDKTAIPEYFDAIKQPIAFDVIKKKLKRKKYNSVDQFMRDVDLLYDNAKSFNEDGSQIYEDAVEMQAEAHRLAKEEKSKPDTEYVMEDGRIPLPDGILHNAQLWKVGE